MKPASRIVGAASIPVMGLCFAATAQGPCDFSEVTQLANDAVAGIGVETPVPGFELLLLRDGTPVYRRAFGTATLGQVYAADSATKTISAAVIMSLVDQSAQPFSLDTRVSDYIPQFAGLKQPITIRQAFSHTSNLRSSNAINNPSLTMQQAAIEIASDPVRCFQGACGTGTSFSYGGTSMQVAGAVAEIVAGASGGPVSWNTIFQQRIAGPLQWTLTNYYFSSAANPLIGGGCESNAPEFARLMEMIRRDGEVRINGQDVRVLSPASARAIVTRQTPKGIPIANTPFIDPPTDGADYGVGMWLGERDADGDIQWCIAAGARGFSSWIDFDDRIVGVFATDLTSSQNTQLLMRAISTAAQNAIRACDATRVCDSIDFNNDGSSFDPQDIAAYLSVFSEGPCIPAPATCNDIDFNNDGSLFDPRDIDAFLSVFSEGPCF
jgi:CubicO group peptidase (beta-lactamase class C family)